MASSPPDPAMKRPWYVFLAIFASMSIGLVQGCNGMSVMAILHADGVDVSAACEQKVQSADGTTNADDADHVRALCEASLASMSNARGRVFPIAIATLLLGYAAAFFAIRARGRRAGSRPLLVQIIAAQALLAIVSYVLLADTRRAELDFRVAEQAAKVRATISDPTETAQLLRIEQFVARLAGPLALGLGELTNLLLIVALTRPRARAFFDAAGDPST